MSETKNCPECAEQVGAEDAKCRHCGAGLAPPVEGKPGISCLWALLAWLGSFGALVFGLSALITRSPVEGVLACLGAAAVFTGVRLCQREIDGGDGSRAS